MGLGFQNINMLSGFPIGNRQSDGNAAAGSAKSAGAAFQALLASALGLQSKADSICPQNDILSIFEPSLPDFPNAIPASFAETNPAKADAVEIKEQAKVNSDILRVILSNCGDTIRIILPKGMESQDGQDQNAKIDSGCDDTASAKFRTEPIPNPKCEIANITILPKDVSPLLSCETAKPESQVNLPQSNYPAPAIQVVESEPLVTAPMVTGSTIINFKISDLFRSQAENCEIPVQIIKSNQQPKLESVGIDRLTDLISRYTEPITIEIENFERAIFAPIIEENNTQSETPISKPTINFSFDLREVIKEDTARPFESKGIRGILTSAKPFRLAESVPARTDNPTSQPAVTTDGKTSLGDIPTVKIAPNMTPYLSWESETNRAIADTGIGDDDTDVSIKGSSVAQKQAVGKESFYGADSTTQEMDLKSKPRIKQKAIPNRQAKIDGKFELAVAPDQFGPRKIRIQQLPFDLKENENIQQAKFDEIKGILLRAIDRNIKTLKLRLEPKELGSLDIKLNLKDDGVSILLKTDNHEATNILGARLADLKGGLENANVKILELHIVSDKTMQADTNGNGNRELAGGFGRQDKPANQQDSEGKSGRAANAFDRDIGGQDAVNLSNKNGWINIKA